MAKQIHDKFESLDYLRKNEAFAEYRAYWDNFDPKVKDINLKKFICKMPLNNKQRSALIDSINSPIL